MVTTSKHRQSASLALPGELLATFRTSALTVPKSNTYHQRNSWVLSVFQLHLPKSSKKTVLMARECGTQRSDEVGHDKQEIVAQPASLESDFPLLDFPGIRFDDHGMIVPHSILGSLEDFRKYLEAKGETELLKQIPRPQRNPAFEATGRHDSRTVKRNTPSDYRNTQSNALQHWQTHMGQRRRQQEILSDKLKRPAENLLMNQDNHFKETQEQKEFLSRAMPHIHSGYGYRVGSEFWRLPQRYGDEISGITTTLTQTEQGRRVPVTHVGQPKSIRQESGIICFERLDQVSLRLNKSAHLQQQCQELGAVLNDMEIKKPDIDGLEVVGSSKPYLLAPVCCSPLLEKEKEEHKEMKMETHDNVKDVVSGGLRIPALRFCGQVARWTGNSTSNQNEVGISDTLVFEAPTGEIASAHLELHNVGSTAIFYSWQQIHVPHLQLLSQQKGHYFYFNRSPDVIVPGDTQHVEFTFKSELAGIKTEIWQLNTHPVLLQGASMQVKLKGYAVYQDKNADEKLLLEKKQEKEMTHKMCQSIVYKMLQGVHTPERPSSPAELYITEEEDFVRKNPKWQYFEKPVGELKRLWHEVNPGHTWDLSVETLRQAILSLPLQQSIHNTITREEGLRQLNCFPLGLSEPYELKYNHPTPDIIGQQLWRNLLDMMDDEATRLRQVLGLPVNETWIDKEYLIPDADLAENINKDDRNYKKEGAAAKEERNVVKYRLKDDNKGESKTTATEKTAEVKVKKKGEKKDEVGKGKGKQTQERESVLATQPLSDNIRKDTPKDELEDPDRMNIYKQFLHKTVYALMEDLVDTFCDLMDEGQALDMNTGNENENDYFLD